MIYIRIENIELGSFPVSPKAKLCLWLAIEPGSFVGTKHIFPSSQSQCISKIWDFKETEPNKQLLRITLVKSRVFKGDQPLGKIKIQVNSFPSNLCVTQKFILDSLAQGYTSPTITITLHRSLDGSPPFSAPSGKMLTSTDEARISDKNGNRASFSAGSGFFAGPANQTIPHISDNSYRYSVPNMNIHQTPSGYTYSSNTNNYY